ncbi:Gp19/Gp15/Gp42 family protein [Actinomyces faecalis]|uniref:Gp19/Gp15/Gp42 family protein n=1 Tax=Actinomyces faecalis TaxID=2722820 RepID=UPI0015565A06|nr:Gp19/Gp15/Gp42 family protein [Actinomyces faecalis]
MSTLPAPAAAAEDVQASLMRGLTPAESAYVDTLLARVHNRVRVRLPDLVDRADRDETVRALLVEVEAEAVARVFRADGAIYTSESEGEYSYQLNDSVASAALRVTDDEWARLGSPLSSVTAETDGYLATRLAGRVPPDRRFQLSWPGLAYPSELL